MDVIKLPVLCDYNITGGILICRQTPVSAMNKARANRRTPTSSGSAWSSEFCWVSTWRRHGGKCKQGGVNRSNTRSRRYMQTRARMFGMWLLCQVKLRRFDTSSESLGKRAGHLTMRHRAFFRGRGRRDWSKWTISASRGLPIGVFASACKFLRACDS